MTLHYTTYQALLSGLENYAKERNNAKLYDIKFRQNEIFNYYISKYGSFVCENKNKTKQLFSVNAPEQLKQRRRSFRKFMDEKNANDIKQKEPC